LNEKRMKGDIQMKILYRAVGNNIRSARKQRGLTQERMAEMCGMSLVHYGRLERGQRRVSLEQIALIAEMLCVRPEVLIEGMTLSSCAIEKESVGSLGLIIDFLCAGCSDEACALMLEVCTAIAKRDKC